MSFLSALFGKKKKGTSTVSSSSASSFSSANNPLAALGFQVMDFRSEEEKAIERNSGKPLKADREQLAQDMFDYLRSHDTGNSMHDYEEIRTRFHDRAEKIGDEGGRPALQEVYYRISALCNSTGSYFHGGAVDNAFDGSYWQK